mgnify:CR=1 FL=1
MTLPATDGILEKLQALLAYDASSPLIFSSGLFLFLFAGFMLIYNAFRRAPMARIVYVILFSLYFYYKSSGIYFLLLIFAATSDFLIAQGIYRVRSRAAKRWLVVLSVMVNLGMLGYFKYTNFLVDIANQMFGQGFLQFQNIFLPVGISFFVFQSMSYTIDIYRGQLKPLGNWCDYLFYLSFFPQLVAGPIVRARDFIPQIRRNRAGKTSLWQDFASIFGLTIANFIMVIPYILAFFAVFKISGGDISHEGVGGFIRAAFTIAGFFGGAAAWWTMLAFVINLFRRRFRPRHMLTINHVAGLIIGILGIYTILSTFFDIFPNVG